MVTKFFIKRHFKGVTKIIGGEKKKSQLRNLKLFNPHTACKLNKQLHKKNKKNVFTNLIKYHFFSRFSKTVKCFFFVRWNKIFHFKSILTINILFLIKNYNWIIALNNFFFFKVRIKRLKKNFFFSRQPSIKF